MRPCHRVCDAVAHGVDSVVSLGSGHTTVSLYVALVALALNLAVTTVRTSCSTASASRAAPTTVPGHHVVFDGNGDIDGRHAPNIFPPGSP
ncbi:hypothetical protein [Streptomyces sp. NPDC056337]|uniref:hypothetical protein n=1 Tax=Streptomyces sp. NPDC056337 TaxID=3345787 RepID=UPI0035E0CE6F